MTPARLAVIHANKTSPYALQAWGSGLAPLPDKMTADQAKAVIPAAFTILQISSQKLIVDLYAGLIAGADRESSHDERVLHILRVLDHPLIGDGVRKSLLASLTSIAGPPNDFNGRF